MDFPPEHVQVLICGAGPAGAYAAAALAREGIRVALLESGSLPRYHVGESLIPSVRHQLRFIGAEQKVADHGFVRKPGSAIKFNQYKREGYTDFVALGHDNNAWNVIRSEFDSILLDHAAQAGSLVFQNTRAVHVDFDPSDSRPRSVTWVRTNHGLSAELSGSAASSSAWPSSCTPPNRSPLSSMAVPPSPASFASFSSTSTLNQPSGQITFDYLIDATGRSGLLSTKYSKIYGERRMNKSLKNIAVWGYWKNTEVYKGSAGHPDRTGAPWFEALTDETGWSWFIPLHDGTTSVGIVTDASSWNQRTGLSGNLAVPGSPQSNYSWSSSSSSTSSLTDRYLSAIHLAPGLIKLLGSGSLIPTSVKSASDFSYSSARYGGPGWRMVGDAGAFIDPLFSSGIHLAMSSALSAAASICAIIRGDCSEERSAKWYNARVGLTYTRFQIVVMSAYKQIRAQNQNVLSDVDEDNYDRAFAFLRPVIQGAGDMGAHLSESELQNSLDFCVNLFNPTSPEQHARVGKNLGLHALMDVTTPALHPDNLQKILSPHDTNVAKPVKGLRGRINQKILGFSKRLRSKGENASVEVESVPDSPAIVISAGDAAEVDDEARMVLNKINARRCIHPEYGTNNLETEALEGCVVRLVRGKLGLLLVNNQ